MECTFSSNRIFSYFNCSAPSASLMIFWCSRDAIVFIALGCSVFSLEFSLLVSCHHLFRYLCSLFWYWWPPSVSDLFFLSISFPQLCWYHHLVLPILELMLSPIITGGFVMHLSRNDLVHNCAPTLWGWVIALCFVFHVLFGVCFDNLLAVISLGLV